MSRSCEDCTGRVAVKEHSCFKVQGLGYKKAAVFSTICPEYGKLNLSSSTASSRFSKAYRGGSCLYLLSKKRPGVGYGDVDRLFA